jgi:O-antigen/teichoic acid export membrane protein
MTSGGSISAPDGRRAGSRRRFGLQVCLSAATQVGRAVQQFVLLVVVTKRLGADAYGVWAQVVVTIGLLSPIGMLLLEPAVIRFLPESEGERGQRQLLLRFGMLTVAGSLIVGGLLVVGAGPLLRFVPGGEAAMPYVRLIAVVLAAEGLIVLVLAFWRARGRTAAFAALSLGRDAGAVGVISTVVLRGGSVRDLLVVYVAYQWAYAVMAFGGSVLRRGWPGLTLTGAGRQIRFVAPLVLNHPLGWAGKYANIYVISLLLGAAPVGVYSAARHLSDVLGFLSGPLLLVLAPALAAFYVRGEVDEVRDYMRAGLSYFLLGALPLASIATLYAFPILRIVSSADIAVAGAPLVPWLAAAMVLSGAYSILAEAAYLTRRTWFFPPVWVTLAVVQITLNIALVPRLGLLGSAMGELAAAGSVLICAAWLAHKAVGASPDLAEAAKLLVAALGSAAVVALIDPRRTGVGAAVYIAAYPAALVGLRAQSLRRLFWRTLTLSGLSWRPTEIRQRP